MLDLKDYKELNNLSLLVVDDEETLVDVLRETVGVAVKVFDSAPNGYEALMRTAERDYDFIILDVKMAEMGGIEFFRRLTRDRPHLCERVIFTTGDTETEATRSFIAQSGCKALDKPFLIRDLLDLIKSVATGRSNG